MILAEVGPNMYGYVEAHGSFDGIYSWKLQLMEAMEASTSTDSGNFHVLRWKFSLTSVEANLFLATSMEISMEITILLPIPGSFHASTLTSKEVSMKVNGNFHGR